MSKDPRFNFYPDNYMGGTIGFTLEQHGAYVQLMILQSKIGPFTEYQALDWLMSITRGNTAVSTAMWSFLLPKFETDGEKFWSGRLMKEIEKSKRFSEKQSERVKNRYSKKETDSGNTSGTQSGSTAVLPIYRTGTGTGSSIEFEKECEEKLSNALDEIYLNQERMKWPHIDFDFELKAFMNKVRGSPDHYRNHDTGGIRLALQAQLRHAKPKSKTTSAIKGNPTGHVNSLVEGFKRRHGGPPQGG